MLTRFFGNLRIETFVLALIVSFLLAALVWLPAVEVGSTIATIFGKLSVPPVVVKAAVFTFVPLLSAFLNIILNRIGLIRANYMAMPVTTAFLMLGFYYVAAPVFIPLLILLVWAAQQLFRLSGQGRVEETLFTGGFITGLYMLFNPSGWPLLFIFIIALMAYGAVSTRYFILPFFGAAALLFNVFIWPYIFNAPLDFPQNWLPEIQNWESVLSKGPRFIIFILAVGVAEYLTGLGKAKIVKRQFMGVVIYNILLALICYLLLQSGDYWMTVLLLFGSILIANALNFLGNKWLKDGLFLSVLAYVFILYFT